MELAAHDPENYCPMRELVFLIRHRVAVFLL